MNSRDRQFWTEFLLLYRSLPAVWQIQSPDYGCRELKAAGYEQLVRKLSEVEPEANRTTVVRKINSFRTNFRRDVRRRDQCSAMGKSFQSTLWYFNLLSFLEGKDTAARSQKTVERRREYSKEKDGDQESHLPQKCDSFKEIKEESLLSQASAQSVTPENNYAFSTFPEIPEEKSSSIQRLSETEALTQTWGYQFEELSQSQRIIVRKLISDILYYGCMEQLNPSHVDQINQLLRTKDIGSERIFFNDNT
ncbi:uncharacterized protein LOC110181249 [Drosophila serrata]|uniref:uncharacterized protein LOC110181249 n=1 Tax=Drosophila serrata TaxID=7274 RepID=UPI000A1D1DB8|nr:uncharacterized protein LOC110181249 [Drosophila serrata]